MKVDSYSFGRVVIEGREYRNDVIIFPDRVKDNWWRDKGHFLQLQDLGEVFSEEPDVLIVGKGASGAMKVSEEVKEKAEEKGIQFRAERTEKAVELYNRLSGKGKGKAIAALRLTC